MIGKDDNQEEVTFKVADRRKFNSDGSLKEGVTLEPETPKKEPKAAGAAAAPGATKTDEAPDLENESLSEEDEIPGADDPASFVNFLSTLATNAAASLGAVPHPATG